MMRATMTFADNENSVLWTKGCGVRSVSATILRLPTIRAHKLSNAMVSYQDIVLVKVLLDNGIVGIGEAATLGGPRWAEESVESIKSIIDLHLAPSIVGQQASFFEANAIRMSKAATRNYAAKGAMESALIDAVGLTLNLPASAFLGGQVRDRMGVIWALASGDIGQELEEAKEKLHLKEHRDFKVKLGFTSPEHDIQRLTRLREGLGDQIKIIVDVNQGWSEAQCITLLPILEELKVALVEQPIKASLRSNLARVAARTSIPFLLDEGAFQKEEIADIASNAGASVYSLKLVKSGGLFEMKRAAAVAAAHGMELYGGCLLESSVGSAAHLAVFCTLPELQWGTEHFGSRILVEDIAVKSLKFENFEILVPTGPGLGVQPNDDLIQFYSRQN